MLKKIVVIGPESTGKTTLCEQLAEHYNRLWCPEYAREYLLTIGTRYSYSDLLVIAKGQLELEDKYSKMTDDRWRLAGKTGIGHPSSDILFIDTDMYVMKVWCEFVFGKCHQFILDQISGRKYDLYLLCNTDLPWTPDDLREYPDRETRDKLYLIYKNTMTNQSVPWVEIKGDIDRRLEEAIQSVDSCLRNE